MDSACLVKQEGNLQHGGHMKRISIIVSVIVCNFLHQAWASQDSYKILTIYGQARTTVQKYVAAEDLRGVLIAVDDINARGGVLGSPVEVIDGRAVSTAEAQGIAMKHAEKKDLLAVVGANTSNITLSIAPILQDKQIPVISPIATNPKVTRVGDYIFRACFTDPFQGRVMARYALNDLNAGTAVILKKVSSKFSVGVSKYFEQAFEPRGKVLWQGAYLAEDVDFTTILTKVQELGPDVVFVPGHGRDSGMILKQAHAFGIQSTFLGADGWGKGALGVGGPKAAQGHAFSNHWHMNVNTEQSKAFVKKYHDKFGPGLIAASAALAYDSAMIIASAANAAGALDHKKIRDRIAAIKNFTGVTGSYTFDQNGDPVNKDAVILKYHDGDIVYVKTIRP